MANRFQVSKQRNFLAGYVCSRCKAVNISEVNLIAIGESGSRFNAEAAANAAFGRGVKALSVMHEKTFFADEPNEELKFGFSNSYSLKKLSYPCPCCKNRERWQCVPEGNGRVPNSMWDDELQRLILEDIPQESCPVIMDSVESMETWKNCVLAEQRTMLLQHWASKSEELTNIQTQLEELENQVHQTEKKKETVGLVLQNLIAQYNSKKEEVKQYPLFSVERKAVNAEAKAIDKQIKIQEKTDEDERCRLAAELSRISSEKKELMIANPGVNNTLQTYKGNRPGLRVAFRID